MINKYTINNPGTATTLENLFLHVKKSGDILEELTGTYVDDWLNADSFSFEESTKMKTCQVWFWATSIRCIQFHGTEF